MLEPTLDHEGTLHHMLSRRPHCDWHMGLADGDSPAALAHSKWRSCILADSTIMLDGCHHHWVLYDQELLGVAVGRYGGAFCDGSLEHLKDWFTSGKAFACSSPSWRDQKSEKCSDNGH